MQRGGSSAIKASDRGRQNLQLAGGGSCAHQKAMFRYISRTLVTAGAGVEFALDLLATMAAAGDARGSPRRVGAFAAAWPTQWVCTAAAAPVVTPAAAAQAEGPPLSAPEVPVQGARSMPWCLLVAEHPSVLSGGRRALAREIIPGRASDLIFTSCPDPLFLLLLLRTPPAAPHLTSPSPTQPNLRPACPRLLSLPPKTSTQHAHRCPRPPSSSLGLPVPL
jgi:hypothetical protein